MHLGCHLELLLSVVGIGQSLSLCCMDGENWRSGIIRWKLAYDLQMLWIPLLSRLLTHPGRPAYFLFLLPLWTIRKVLLGSHDLAVLKALPSGTRLCISATLLALVVTFLMSFPQNIPWICLPSPKIMVNP